MRNKARYANRPDADRHSQNAVGIYSFNGQITMMFHSYSLSISCMFTRIAMFVHQKAKSDIIIPHAFTERVCAAVSMSQFILFNNHVFVFVFVYFCMDKAISLLYINNSIVYLFYIRTHARSNKQTHANKKKNYLV